MLLYIYFANHLNFVIIFVIILKLSFTESNMIFNILCSHLFVDSSEAKQRIENVLVSMPQGFNLRKQQPGVVFLITRSDLLILEAAGLMLSSVQHYTNIGWWRVYYTVYGIKKSEYGQREAQCEAKMNGKAYHSSLAT